MSIYWYDFETFGAEPFRDRPVQFAGIRTDEDLNIISDPLIIYCKPADDVLPQPDACLVTGITPQLALEKGLPEAEFCRQIHEQFAEPNTCVAGYNSIRFDDEVTRAMLYRNFFDPYAREWQNGNSRWDIIDMVRLTRAVRPEGINWPDSDEGKPSFKLEKLTVANGIEHADAHDALADVIATIEIAKIVRKAQPRLYDYAFNNRSKQAVEQLLTRQTWEPLLHISSRYPAERGCAAIVVPVARDTQNKNAFYAYDLSEDPSDMLALDVEGIQERVFVRQDDLPESVNRIPLKGLHINKCPVVAPLNVLDDESATRLGIDKQTCLKNLELLKASVGADKSPRASELAHKVRDVFAGKDFETIEDPDLMLYSGGFFSNRDRALMDQVNQSGPEQLAKLDPPFEDARLPELLFRYKARNFPELLNVEEQGRWQQYRRRQIASEASTASIQLDGFFQRISELRVEREGEDKAQNILSDLEAYGLELKASLND